MPGIPPARVVAPFDADFYRCQNTVAEGRALWVEHRHLHTSEPMPEPRTNRDDITVSSPAPCCPDDEPMPCAACVSHDGPGDLSDDGWDDDHVWVPSDVPPARSLAEQVDDHARELRARGSPLGDLLAERAESLAAQIRALDATTVEQFRDRRDSLLAADMDRARARMTAHLDAADACGGRAS